MPVSVKDLAQRLNIYISTVSAALQNRHDVSQTTRLHVSEGVKKLGYRPNSLARGLVTRKTDVLDGLVLALSRSLYIKVLKGIDSVTSPSGYNLLVLFDPTQPMTAVLSE